MLDYRNDPLLDTAFGTWERVRGSRFAPCRADIQPSQFRAHLRHMQFIDVVDEGTGVLRFRYRMMGTRLVENFGGEFAGKFVEELFDGEKHRLLNDMYETVCEARRPVFVHCHYRAVKGLMFKSDRLYFPLSEDGQTVTMIMAVLLFESPYAFAGEWSRAEIDPDSVVKKIVPAVA
ncbi:MAG: PAS domain-containing protein [Alphaproteobacteria bacterium]|nr:PAS domain-containing protein [Alphaproteobacteria bacterium]MDE2012452.1 PAS domain-containing protein [Alphaproteobacteria bacterium]MDE2072090.1 PAS domain-containing protein [Alphaproteobacteria bacterium]MDE2352786.1 PAS domain-containing protein [Alphaproteobacteria bacterium]